MLVNIILIVSCVVGAEECTSLCNHEERIGLLELTTKQIDTAQQLQQANFKLQNELTIFQSDVTSCKNEVRLWQEKYVKQTELLQQCQSSLQLAKTNPETTQAELEIARTQLKSWRDNESDGLVRAHVINILPKLYKTWRFKIEIKPGGTLPGYTNILHATTGENCCNAGSRIPAIYSICTLVESSTVFWVAVNAVLACFNAGSKSTGK